MFLSAAVPTVTPDSISVSIGQSATFLCEAPGSPPPSLTWFNGTTEITEETPRTTLTPTTLTLSDIVREDTGDYVCLASYLNGTTQTSASLWVNGEAAPVISNHFTKLFHFINFMDYFSTFFIIVKFKSKPMSPSYVY